MLGAPNWVTDPVLLARWFVEWMKRHADAGVSEEKSVPMLVAHARMRGATDKVLCEAAGLIALEAEAEERFDAIGL